MAFQGAFTVTQNTESTITLTDSSTGSDPTITERRIYIFKYDGTTIVPDGTTTDYIVWALADTSITLEDIFSRDYAVNIEVDWVSSNPDPNNTYTETILYDFYWYAMLFLCDLTANIQARNPSIFAERNFMFNKFQCYTYILDSQNAVSLMTNIYDAQRSLDKAYEMIQNQSTYFTP
jgi:hypothetical protein